MFRKNNFTVKTSTNLRHSERKAIFPEAINACFNSKQQFSMLKAVFPNGVVQNVFVHDKEPMFFQCPKDNEVIYPTVYFLWMFPNNFQFPILHIHSSIFDFLQKGSDLMIPGIFLDTDSAFPEFQAGWPVAISTVNEDEHDELVYFGPMAVGKALFSSTEMVEKRLAGQKGKAVEVLHIFGDSLWGYGSKKEFPRIKTGRKMMSGTTNLENPCESDWCDENIVGTSSPEDQKQTGGMEAVEEEVKAAETAEDMDKLLNSTFFGVLRWKLGTEQTFKFPIDAGQFYATYILKNLPPGKKLDIKKTRYKKFSTFLREVNTDEPGSIITLRTVKGIDSIENVNFDHSFIQNAPLLEYSEDGEELRATSSSSATFLTIREQMFSLTEQVMTLFRPAGFHKGDLVDLNQIRAILMDYAQKEKLLKDGGKSLELDDQLQMAVKHFLSHTFPVNTIVQKLAAAMTKTVHIRTRDGQQFAHRGKVPNVEIKVEKRMGNKVVTLVSNFASFGIDAKMVDKEIKGTGTSILPSVAGCDGPQLLIQGNEVNSVGRILQRLGLSTKFIKGLELGVKEKKKK